MSVTTFRTPTGNWFRTGLAADAKPTAAAPMGSLFLETDTAFIYVHNGVSYVLSTVGAKFPGHLTHLFEMVAVAPSLANTRPKLLGSSVTDQIVMPRQGYIVSLTAFVNASVTQGSLTVRPVVAGSILSGATDLVLDTSNPTKRSLTYTSAQAQFANLDALGVAISTTANYAPSTLNLAVAIEVAWR